MKFAREGAPLIFGAGIVTLAAGLLGYWWIGLALSVATLAVAAFFRDPDRAVPGEAGVVVSPADGRIVAVEAAASTDLAPHQTFSRVSIFMSPLNVHVNRVPVSGEVVAIRHTPGRFAAAYAPEASRENERNEVVIRDDADRTVVFAQIAGMLARRIVCRLRVGQRVEQGERYGLIMFGSKVDLYLPQSTALRVRVGDRTRAGSGILGDFR